MRILLVDHHVLFREGLISLVKNQPGIDVVGEAGSADTAIKEAARLRPDVVLMDVFLPDGDGLEVMQKILAQNPSTKVVILTYKESDDLLFDAIRCGARGYLLKNTPLAKLIASLRALERGEAIISRMMTSRILDEFRRLGKATNQDQNNTIDLTSREMEVLGHLGTGASNREIADRLSITENTVKVHVSKILSKLELQNRHAAGHLARRQGITGLFLSNNNHH